MFPICWDEVTMLMTITLLLNDICHRRNLAALCNQTMSVCPTVAEGYVVQEDIYAWKSLGMGKYLTALAVSGLVYLILLFLIETDVLWELKARFSGLYWKQKLVSESKCKSRGWLRSLIPAVCSDLDSQSQRAWRWCNPASGQRGY